MPTFYIRKATADELYDIAELELRSAEHENRLVSLDCGLQELYDIWYQRLLSGNYDILLAETRPKMQGIDQPNKIVGFVGFIAPKNKNGFIQAMYVDPDYFRKRIGLNLFYAAEKVMLARSCPSVSLHVEPFNHKGKKFYTKLGFVDTLTKHHHLLVFTKRLSAPSKNSVIYL